MARGGRTHDRSVRAATTHALDLNSTVVIFHSLATKLKYHGRISFSKVCHELVVAVQEFHMNLYVHWEHEVYLPFLYLSCLLCFLVLCLFLPFSISASFVLFLSFDYVSLSHYFIFPFLFCAFHCFFLFSLSFFTYLITSSFSLFVFYQLFSSFSSLFLSLSFLISVPFFLSLLPLSRIHYFYLAVCLILFIRFSPPPFSLLCSFLSLSFFQFPSYISSFRYLLSIPLYISFFLSSFLPSQLTISAMTSVRQR